MPHHMTRQETMGEEEQKEVCFGVRFQGSEGVGKEARVNDIRKIVRKVPLLLLAACRDLGSL